MNLIAFQVKINFLKVHGSMLILFVVVHVTSNTKKLLFANFSNIVRQDNILKIENIHLFCYNLTTPMQFWTENWYTH